MNYLRSLFIPSVLLLSLCFFISACEETDSVASALLYEDDGDSGGISFSLRNATQWDLGNGVILYGIDIEVTNSTENESAQDIRLDLVGVTPNSFVSDYSTDRREMSFLSASQSQIFSNYWCFYCDQSNEARVGNFYVIIDKAAGSGAAYQLEFSGRYRLAGENVDVNFSRSINTVSSAQPVP